MAYIFIFTNSYLYLFDGIFQFRTMVDMDVADGRNTHFFVEVVFQNFFVFLFVLFDMFGDTLFPFSSERISETFFMPFYMFDNTLFNRLHL